ncbi:MAG: sodium/proline symporter [Bacteroidota bacterium]
MDYQTQLIIVMVAYVGLLILWGIYQGRKVKNSQDYAIAGRNLPGWVAALSERATGESSWALLGLPGAAYATGLTEIWTAIGCVAGIISAWVLIAWRLRDAAEKYNVTTFTEFIAKKHGETGKWIRIIGSSSIIFFFFLYVGAQFIGGGKTLSTMFEGLDFWIGVLITAAVIIPYTIYGGFMSVVYTDVVQAIVMIVTLIVGPIVGFIYLSNHPELFAQSIPDALDKAGSTYTNFIGTAKGFGAGMLIAGGFSWFFGYLGGQPQLSMRFMAIRDKKQAKRARNIGVIWTVIAYIGALCLGWIGIAIFGPHGLEDPESVMPRVILELFPPAIAAILITGAIAAMISTADSLLILSATEFTENILNSALKKNAEKHSLLRSRLVTAILALVALGVAYMAPSDLIFNLVSYVWAGIGGTFSVVILFTLFWKRFHGKAALATIAGGLLFTVLWIGTGQESHYRITEPIITGWHDSGKLNNTVIEKISPLQDKKIISDFSLKNKLGKLLTTEELNASLTVIKNDTKNKGITSRILTFFVALFIAIFTTLILKKKESAEEVNIRKEPEQG